MCSIDYCEGHNTWYVWGVPKLVLVLPLCFDNWSIQTLVLWTFHPKYMFSYHHWSMLLLVAHHKYWELLKYISRALVFVFGFPSLTRVASTFSLEQLFMWYDKVRLFYAHLHGICPSQYLYVLGSSCDILANCCVGLAWVQSNASFSHHVVVGIGRRCPKYVT